MTVYIAGVRGDRPLPSKQFISSIHRVSYSLFFCCRFTSLFSESNPTFCNNVAPEDLSSSPSPVALCINVSPFGASIIYQLLVEPITGFVLR